MVSCDWSGMRRLGGIVLLLAVVGAAWLGSSAAGAAEPELVGVLALAVDDEVAEKLALSPDQKDALAKLIGAREDEAVDLAIKLKDLPAAERYEKLAPFRRESERRGLELLSPEQRRKLEQLRMRRIGLATLAEPAITERLQLTEEQRRQVAELIRERDERTASADKKAVHVVRAEIERSLRGLLTDEQWARWEMLALGPPRPVEPSTPSAPGEADAPEQPAQVAVNEPVEAAEAEAEPASLEASPEAPIEEAGAPAAQPSDAETPPAAEPAQAEPPAAAPPPEPAAPEPSPTKPPAAQPPATETAAPETAQPDDSSPPEPALPPEPLEPPSEDPATENPPEPKSVQVAPPESAEPSPSDAPPEPAEPDRAEPPETSSPQPPDVELAEPSEGQPPEMSDDELLELFETELAPRDEPVRLRFNFRYQPWEDVLDWFAEQAGLALQYESLPTGTCNYVDDREYTVSEALDLLNSLLLIKGYLLVRRDQMLVVANREDFEDGIPRELVEQVAVEDLDERGEYELVLTVFQLETISAEEAEEEVEKLIGPQGSITVLPKAQQLVITETAGRLRTIRDALARIEDPEGLGSLELRTFPLDFSLAEEVLIILRQMFGIPAEENAASDGSIRFAVDPMNMRLIAFGKPGKLDQVGRLLESLQTGDLGEIDAQGVEASLQLEVYNVAPAGPETVLKVAQTLLASSPGARLSIDEETDNLIALCRLEDHATLKSTIEQLRQDTNRVEVIPLRRLDPQLAVLSITKLFGGGADDKDSPLKVDADPTTRQLVVRGPKETVEQIRTWLEKMGETGSGEADDMAAGETVRVVPLSGWEGKSALERLQQIWPAMRPNKIRVVSPSTAIPMIRASERSQPLGAENALLDQLFGAQPRFAPPGEGNQGADPPDSDEPPPAVEPAPAQPGEPESPPSEAAKPEPKSARAPAPGGPARSRFVFASDTAGAKPSAGPSQNGRAQAPTADAQRAPRANSPQPADEPPAIIVAPGPGGIMIASEDLQALEDFEELLTALGSGPLSGTSDLTIFYLVHAQNTVVAQTLDQIFGGGTLAESRDSGGGSLAQDLAGAAFGDAGALVGSLLGLGGGGGTIAPSGSVTIIPTDARLNGLIVRANPTDTESIRQLLEILDVPGSPEEILAQPKPRLIPVVNTQASEIAEVVEEVYAENLQSGSGRGGRPSPMELIEALRGRGRGGSSRSATQQVEKMSIGVDERTNCLVVSAPEPLFTEVKALVEQLDAAALGSSSQAVQVVTLKHSNAEKVQEALKSLVGEDVTFGGSGSSSRRSDRRFGGPSSDAIQGMMMMRAMQGGGGPPGFNGSPRRGFGGSIRRPGGSGGGPPGGGRR